MSIKSRSGRIAPYYGISLGHRNRGIRSNSPKQHAGSRLGRFVLPAPPNGIGWNPGPPAPPNWGSPWNPGWNSYTGPIIVNTPLASPDWQNTGVTNVIAYADTIQWGYGARYRST